jgi:FixJ family two-component response regulator
MRAANREKRPAKILNAAAQKPKGGDQPIPIVVVVDDDPSVLRSLKRLLEVAGLRVWTFDHPSALLATDLPSSHVCIVADIGLPEMTGIEMCQALADSGCQVPAILITGRTAAEIRPLLEQCEHVTVLFKPFDEKPLLDAIARVLALPIGSLTSDRSPLFSCLSTARR